MLAIFHALGKTSWLTENLKIWARESVTEPPHNWIMRVEMFSNLSAFVGFSNLIIEVLSSLSVKTVFKRLSVFINNEKSLLLFPKGVH